MYSEIIRQRRTKMYLADLRTSKVIEVRRFSVLKSVYVVNLIRHSSQYLAAVYGNLISKQSTAQEGSKTF